MSALAGFLCLGAPPAPHLLAAMGRALPQPPGTQVQMWEDAHVSLALVARASDGSLHADPDAGRTAVVDGRLAHPDVLTRALGRPSLASRTHTAETDAALVLAAVDRLGPVALDALDGSFAAAVWDAPTRTLHLVRDAFGTRPLVYARHDGRLLFATSTAALLAAGVSAAPDLWRVAEVLTASAIDPEASAFAAIRRLPAARRMSISPSGSATQTVTWAPERVARAPPGTLDQALREAFDASVQTRLDGADAPGTYLSGGLDSSAIALALSAFRPSVDAVSAAFPGLPAANETPFQEDVAAAGGLRRHVWDAWNVSPIAADHARRLGVADPLWMNTWAMEHGLMQTARGAGIRTLFSGHGGDHLFDLSVDAVVAALLRRGRAIRAWREASAVAAVRGGTAGSWVREAGRTLVRWSLPSSVRRWRMPLLGTELSPALREAVAFNARARAAWALPTSPVEEHLVDFDHPLTHDGLDRIAPLADAFGLRLAFPYWDRRLVELAQQLHPLDLFSGGRSRPVIRRVFADRLPTSVQQRTTKATFDSMLLSSTATYALDAYRAMLDAPGALADWANLELLRADLNEVVRGSPEERLWRRSGGSQRLLRAHALWVWSAASVDRAVP